MSEIIKYVKIDDFMVAWDDIHSNSQDENE